MLLKGLFAIIIQALICFNLSANETIEKYDEDFVALLEMVYGEGLLSQGGVDSINGMFEGIDLDGLKVLDLGSGLGMYDLYLAENNQVDIIGLEPQESLIKKANLNLEKAIHSLKGSVSFIKMGNLDRLDEFKDHSFDIVYSKEALLHVPHESKQLYFEEIYRVLKPGGKIIIMDWMHREPDYTANTKKMMEMDGINFYLVRPFEYENILKKAGFKQIELRDTTLHHVQLSQQNIDSILTMVEKIQNTFGEDIYHYSLESWTYQRDAFQTGELLTGIFKAIK